LNPISLELPLYVGQVSQGSPGFSAVLEGACGCQSEEDSQSFVGLQEGLWCDMGPEVQSGPLDLHLHHLTIHHIFISSLVAQLLDG
jgi:hypothetical protein